MKKTTLFVLLAMLTLTMTSIGCDNRSQMEKDADAAAKKLQGALK